MEEPDVLILAGLARSFGGLRAVAGLDLRLRARSALGLIGPNGAGKSTLLQLVSGLLPATSGTVTFRGRDVTGLPTEERVRMGMGRAFQHPRRFPHLTVGEHLRLALGGGPRSAEELRGSIRGALRRFGLDAFADHPVGDLSMVQMKLLDLARATFHSPSLLLLDEPFAGAGEQEASRLAAAIGAARAGGATILIVEHRLPQMIPLVDELAVMVAGQMIARGAPRAVLRDPDVMTAYLGAVRG